MVSVMAICSIAYAGFGAFWIETGFDDIEAQALTSFSFEQQGTEITITDNAGSLSVIDGIVYPYDPKAGLTITSDRVLDKFEFYGPVITESYSVIRITFNPKDGSTFRSNVPIGTQTKIGQNFGISDSKLNSMIGFTVIGVGIDSLRFDEYGR